MLSIIIPLYNKQAVIYNLLIDEIKLLNIIFSFFSFHVVHIG